MREYRRVFDNNSKRADYLETMLETRRFNGFRLVDAEYCTIEQRPGGGPFYGLGMAARLVEYVVLSGLSHELIVYSFLSFSDVRPGNIHMKLLRSGIGIVWFAQLDCREGYDWDRPIIDIIGKRVTQRDLAIKFQRTFDNSGKTGHPREG